MFTSPGTCRPREVGAHPFKISGVPNASSVLISEGLLVGNGSGRCLDPPRVRLKPAESGCQMYKIEWPEATHTISESHSRGLCGSSNAGVAHWPPWWTLGLSLLLQGSFSWSFMGFCGELHHLRTPVKARGSNQNSEHKCKRDWTSVP